MTAVETETEAGGLELLGKANAVVRALAETGELTAAQLADRTGEPQSSTYRLLQSLTAIDWIESSPRRGFYRLGVYFMRIGGLFEDRVEVRRIAFEPLRDLRLKSGWTSTICVPRGIRAVCVERFDGAQVRSMSLQVGDSLPLHVGAAALAILAFLPPGERRAMIDRLAHDPIVREYPLPPEAELERLLTETQSRGYSRSDSEVTSGIAAFAAPVFNHRKELVASIAVSGLRSPVLDQERQLTHLVQSSAARVSRALGFVGD